MQQSRDELIQDLLARNPALRREDLAPIVAALPLDKILTLPGQELPGIFSALVKLGPDNPVSCIFTPGSPGDSLQMSVFVIGYDHDQLFSILSGILAAGSLDIRQGTLITSRKIADRRLIIDFFSGRLPPGSNPAKWSDPVSRRIAGFYEILEQTGSPEAKREQVQQRIIELVGASLGGAPRRSENLLIPIHLEIEQKEHSTGMEIKSSDTPFFLFSLATVLNLHRIRIEQVNIETRRGRLIDTIEFTDMRGQRVTSERKLNRIKLSILISKQFTFFLDQAPDPVKALSRFDSLIQDVQQLKAGEDIRQLLASPEFHGELARLLGTSDFIWEDFIRIQRDSILPMLHSVNRERLLSTPPELMESALNDHLNVRLAAAGVQTKSGGSPASGGHSDPGGATGAQQELIIEELNNFKNRMSFLIDLDHILVKDLDFFFLSDRLSALAVAVIRRACSISRSIQTAQYGVPRTAAGLEAQWAVFGLGKLGGQAMGYASDLELLFVYSDSGSTDGEKPIANRDFFEKMFKSAAGIISAKKEGIFQVDLRLRPYGEDGPLGVKLDKFNEYYHQGGKAHSAERLALVRLRHIGGSPALGAEVMKLRDHIVYESDSIIVPELRDLRKIQLAEKTGDDRINAKFSPGGLVDLEYNVQILQVIHGRSNEYLRGPGIHAALLALKELGTIAGDEAEAMVRAYRFMRSVINGLRMLRGNAEDLFLPDPGEREFRHLARRIGYRDSGELSEADQLNIDFETHSARVRQFVERHLGRQAIPGSRKLTVVDIVIGEEQTADENENFFRSQGFSNPQNALVNLLNISEKSPEEGQFIQLIILAWPRIRRTADPDMALNNWEQFVRRLEDPAAHFSQLLSQPMRMDILFQLFASSQFLADTLIRNPGFFFWATDPDIVARPRTQIEMEEVLLKEADAAVDREDWQNRLRLMRKREILRIGVRDIALGVKIEEIMGEISFLARACCEVSLKEAWRRDAGDQSDNAGESAAGIEHGSQRDENPFYEWGSADISSKEGPAGRMSVLAFGKLGGWELNYSSDIDLLCVYQPEESADRDAENQLFTRVFREMVKDLNDFTREGQAYRVDMRLRPYGASGPLVSSLPSLLSYYRRQAAPWEFQAMIKLKPIAGNLVLGERMLDELKPLFDELWTKVSPREIIGRMRDKSIAHHIGGDGSDLKGSLIPKLESFDVKNDRGGIRDIEFFIQGMQMEHSAQYPAILTGNSLRGLQLLLRSGLISEKAAADLGEYYRFFRKVEHYLQLAENRQEHRLPSEPEAREKLARCIEPTWVTEEFYRYFVSALKEVHGAYSDFIKRI